MDEMNPYVFPGLPEVSAAEKMVKRILPILLERYNLTEERFYKRTKDNVVVYVRQLMSYWLKRKYKSKISLNAIALLTGVQHHTTVMNNIRRYEGFIKVRSELPAKLQHLASDTKEDYLIVDNLIRTKNASWNIW